MLSEARAGIGGGGNWPSAGHIEAVRGYPHREAGTHRLLGLELRRLARASYPERAPRRRWLELYAERFDTVEVNTTFYRLPARDAVAAWATQTPESFIFVVKASRYLTHIKRLGDLGEGIRRFYERIEPLQQAGRLGPVLCQLPANFHRDDERPERWLEALPDGLHTIEFRHPSWFAPEVMDALRRRQVAQTAGDHELQT